MGGVNKLRPTNRAEYLSGLPEEVYSKKRSSHMVRLLDALCGGAGVEAARNHLMLKRLQTSLDETHYNDLDEFYGRVLGFRRLEANRTRSTRARASSRRSRRTRPTRRMPSTARASTST